MDEVLLLLVKKGAHVRHVRITTSEIGAILGMSQQNASARLSKSEQLGLVEKTKDGIALTKKGAEEAYAFYAELKNAFEKKAPKLYGAIVSGLGEGRYYLSLQKYKKQIREKLGFEAYEGTLNVKLSEESAAAKSHFLKNSEPVIIKGFRKGERTFGDLYAYPCAMEKHKCALVVPLRTHHPSEIVEIISPVNLKKALNKKDGDAVKIELQ